MKKHTHTFSTRAQYAPGPGASECRRTRALHGTHRLGEPRQVGPLREHVPLVRVHVAPACHLLDVRTRGKRLRVGEGRARKRRGEGKKGGRDADRESEREERAHKKVVR